MEIISNSVFSMLSLVLIVIFGAMPTWHSVEAVPTPTHADTKRSTESPTRLESLVLRLQVLQEVEQDSHMKKFKSICNIAEAAKTVYYHPSRDAVEGSRLVAETQMKDICNWILTHTVTDGVDCDTIASTIDTIETVCSEVDQYTGIQESVNTVIEKLSSQVNVTDILSNTTTFAAEFTENLPNPVQNVICGPYMC